MKVESVDEGFRIFIHNCYSDSVNFHNKTEIEDSIRNILEKICHNYRIKLKGFYRVKIYPNSIGTFLEVIKIDDDNYDGCEIDFRIVVVFNKEIYLKVDNYDYVSEYDCLYLEGFYYVNLENIPNYFQMSDFGEVVSSDLINFDKGIFIQKNKTC